MKKPKFMNPKRFIFRFIYANGGISFMSMKGMAGMAAVFNYLEKRNKRKIKDAIFTYELKEVIIRKPTTKFHSEYEKIPINEFNEKYKKVPEGWRVL